MAFDISMIVIAAALGAGALYLGWPIALWLPAFIAALGILFTRRSAHEQGKLANRKLFLDLVGRRAQWLDEASSSWNELLREVEENIERMLRNEEPEDTPAKQTLRNKRQEAKWLFGAEVGERLDELVEGIENYESARALVRRIDTQPQEHRDEALEREARGQLAEQMGIILQSGARIQAALLPYIFVGDVKHASPPKS